MHDMHVRTCVNASSWDLQPYNCQMQMMGNIWTYMQIYYVCSIWALVQEIMYSTYNINTWNYFPGTHPDKRWLQLDVKRLDPGFIEAQDVLVLASPWEK